MAKLSAHGKDRLVYVGMKYRKAYCQDGKVLKDVGNGWKLHGTVKKENGFTYETAYRAFVDKVEAKVNASPSFRAYRDLLMKYVPSFKKRSMFCMLMDTLGPDEADGIWSEIHDGYGADLPKDLSLDDIVELCNLYGAMEIEKGYTA